MQGPPDTGMHSRGRLVEGLVQGDFPATVATRVLISAPLAAPRQATGAGLTLYLTL